MYPADDGLASRMDDLPPVFIDRSLNLARAAPAKGRDYWLGLCHGRTMPTRADIQPRAMRSFLPYVGLIEPMTLPDNHGDYAVRISGGKIEEVFGSLSGKPISQSLPQITATRWRQAFDEVRRGQAPLAVTGRMAADNLRHLKYEVFIAPLGENGTVHMLFGVLDIWPVI